MALIECNEERCRHNNKKNKCNAKRIRVASGMNYPECDTYSPEEKNTFVYSMKPNW